MNLADRLFTGQFVVVSTDGLVKAKNLISCMRMAEDEAPHGAIQRASNQCALAVIQQLLMSNGSTVVTAPFSEKAQRQKVGRGSAQSISTTTGAVRDDTTTDEGPTIDRLRVQWWGDLEGGPSGLVTCKLTGPVRPLDIVDEVPRGAIFYEEIEPGKIRTRMSGHLRATSLKLILAKAPLAVTDSIDTSSSGSQAGAAASVDTAAGRTNHAGFYVANQPPLAHEERMWQATLKEIKGFTWQPPTSIVETDPPSYKVIGIRRWNGAMWATVLTSNGDTQEDHTLDSIRLMMFNARVRTVSQ